MLEFLLSADFPGRDQLQKQMDQAEVVADCDCGCGTIDLVVKDPIALANVREPIPIEAYGKGLDVLLLVRHGRLVSLEIVDHGNNRPLAYPAPKDLILWIPTADRPARRSQSNP